MTLPALQPQPKEPSVSQERPLKSSEHSVSGAPLTTVPDEPAVVGKYYTRTGGCTECGKCCADIYLLYAEKTIETVEEFEALREDNADYEQFIPIETTVQGVVFRCKHLGDDNRCTTYETRPELCRLYPNEVMMLKGGYLPEECGYLFTLRKTFASVLAEKATAS